MAANSDRVKVNQQFVDELLSKSKNTEVKKVLEDDRFKGMFEDNEFKRDVNSEAYKHMKPVANKEDSSDDEANAPRKGLNSLFAGG